MGQVFPLSKPRLTVVGATYASEEPRKKIESLAGHFDLTCITADDYTGYGLRNRLSEQPRPTTYRLVGLPAVGAPDSTTRYWLRGLRRAMRDARPQIVIVETEPWAWLRWQAWWCARTLGVPVCFGEFSWENIRRPGWRGRVLSLVYRAAAATADFVIGGSRDAGAFFTGAGLPPERLLVSAQLGVDETVFHPADGALKAGRRADLGLPPDAFLVGFSGRLVEMKGVPDLIEAVRRVRATPGGERVQLALLGPGEIGPLLPEGENRPAWLHVRPACVHADMAKFLQTLDLFVLPSREWRRGGHYWREQFGHVLIEAMACGVPTLGSDSGAIPEVLNRPDMIFPSGQPERLAARLSELVAMPAARRADLARAQREDTLSRFTHQRLAAEWAEFLCARLPAAGRTSSRDCALTDHRIRFTGDRPRRFLDNFEAVADGELTLCCAFEARDDEELQRKLAFLKTPRARALFSYALAPWQTLISYAALRRAEFIYCEGPHYFWLLVILHRFGLFPVRGKRGIGCLFFPHSRFEKKLRLLDASPPVFRPFFITREQIRLLEEKGAAPGRLRLIDWKIDARWFHPAASPTRDFILCPGNIHRDETLVAALAGSLGLPLVRAGRMSFLRETYAPLVGRQDFRLEVNLDHRAYRRLVQNAALILLPIEPCDEPAGLTAALEALACRTPVLANPSLGVGPLLERAFGPGCLLPDLAPETWRAAVLEVLARPVPEADALLDAGRLLVDEHHAIASEKQDWRDFAAQATL